MDESAHYRKVLSLGTLGRHIHELAGKEKQFDPEDEDYAVDKGEEHKETIAKVSVSYFLS